MLRWARRLAIAFGVLMLFAAWMIGGAGNITARPADPMLWPAARRPHDRVFLVSNGYHAGLALPRATLAEFASGRGYPALIAVSQRFAAYDWIEFGWGDREFYRSVPTVGRHVAGARATRIVLPRKQTVLHVVGIAGDPRGRSSGRDRESAASRNGFDRCWRNSTRPSCRRSRARCRSSAAASTGRACSIRRMGRSASAVSQSLDRRAARRGRIADRPVLATSRRGSARSALAWRVALVRAAAGIRFRMSDALQAQVESQAF